MWFHLLITMTKEVGKFAGSGAGFAQLRHGSVRL
jgi:hypothetical protein